MSFNIVPMDDDGGLSWWYLENSISIAKAHVPQAVNIRDELLDADATYYVAIYGNKVCGFSGIRRTGINRDKVYEIPWCIVHPDYRGQGLARGLTKRCVRHVSIWGGHVILLSTPEPRFYSGLGFKTVVEMPEDIWARHLMMLVLE